MRVHSQFLLRTKEKKCNYPKFSIKNHLTITASRLTAFLWNETSQHLHKTALLLEKWLKLQMSWWSNCQNYTLYTEIPTWTHDFCKLIIAYSSWENNTTRWTPHTCTESSFARRGRWEKYACAGIIIQMQLTRWLHASSDYHPHIAAPPPHSITPQRSTPLCLRRNIEYLGKSIYARMHTN